MTTYFPGRKRPDFCLYVPFSDNSGRDYVDEGGDAVWCYTLESKKGGKIKSEYVCNFFPRGFVANKKAGKIEQCNENDPARRNETLLTQNEIRHLKSEFGDFRQPKTEEERYKKNLSGNLFDIGVFLVFWIFPISAILWFASSILSNNWKS